MADAQAVADVATRAMVGASRLFLQSIGRITASLRRWKTFAIQSRFCSGDFLPDRLSKFLLQVTQGGPTAASAVFGALRWLNDNWGARSLSRISWLSQTGHHTAKQAAELQPWHLVRVSGELTGCLPCLRCRQQFRASALNTLGSPPSQGTMAPGWSFEGKSRRQGVRPAYSWATLWQVTEASAFLLDRKLSGP